MRFQSFARWSSSSWWCTIRSAFILGAGLCHKGWSLTIFTGGWAILSADSVLKLLLLWAVMSSHTNVMNWLAGLPFSLLCGKSSSDLSFRASYSGQYFIFFSSSMRRVSNGMSSFGVLPTGCLTCGFSQCCSGVFS